MTTLTPAKYFIVATLILSIFSINSFSQDKKAEKACELGNAQSTFKYNAERALCVKVK